MVRMRPVETQRASFSHEFSAYYLNDLNNYLQKDHLYYVVNHYNDSPTCTLYGFKIIKETAFFYFLQNRRVYKKSCRPFSSTPEEAFKASLKRAHNYIRILTRRASNVSTYLSCMDSMKGHTMQELRIFEKIAKEHGGEDTIPLNAFKSDIRFANLDELLEPE